MQIAILGCGQLARMLAQAARPLGVSCNFAAIAGEGTSCVDGLGQVVPWDTGDVTAASVEALYRMLGSPAVITVERESIDVELLRALQNHCRVYPNPDSVRYCQNRRLERRLLAATDIPCSPHGEAFSAADVVRGAERLGLPLVVKSAESGYDGKNQWRLRSLGRYQGVLHPLAQGGLVTGTVGGFPEGGFGGCRAQCRGRIPGLPGYRKHPC